MKKTIRLTESELNHLIKESMKSILNEYGGWSQDPMEWGVVNTSQDGRDIYKIGLWWGSGYSLDIYLAWADSDEEALNYVVAYITNNNPKDIESSDRDAEYTIQEIMKEKSCDREEAEESPEFDEMFMYVDATMEGATHACYIWRQNLSIMKAPEEWKQKFLAREQNSNVSGNEMNESHGLGYGLSNDEKRKVRDEYNGNGTRKYNHKHNRGVKGKPGEKSKKTYDIFKREGDKGNPWSKTLKKGGTADWVANMHDDDTNESVGRKTIRLTESDISRMIMEAMNELDWKTYANAAKKRFDQLDDDSVEGTWNDKFHKAYNLEKAANSAFDNEYIGDMKYDTLGDKLKGKHSPTFNGYMQLGNKDRMPYGTINGYNKSGGKIFSTDKGVYHSNGGGLTTPGKFFKNKEVADAYSKANDELWDYDKGNYRYEKGKGWTKDELEEAITRAIRKYLK